MAKLTKIVNGEYIGGNKYKITSTGDGKSTIDFSPDTVLTPGTPVGAEVLNEIQKNGLYTLIGTKRVVGQEDIYDCTFEGIENFDFEEINILLKPNANSTMQNVFVNVGGSKYKITSILGTHCNIFANQNIGLTLKKSTLQAIKWDMSDDTKLPKGSLPTTIKSGKDLYDMLENNGGINIDTALLYLNDAGTKTAGKVYFDKNKKGLFECIKTTTNTVNSTEFFVDISNKASSDRLANLPKIIFDGKVKTFIIPTEYREAKLFLVTFFAIQDSTMSDTMTVFIKNNEKHIVNYKAMLGTVTAYNASLEMTNYVLKQCLHTESSIPVNQNEFKILKVVAFY